MNTPKQIIRQRILGIYLITQRPRFTTYSPGPAITPSKKHFDVKISPKGITIIIA